jgi:hypothetical protein
MRPKGANGAAYRREHDAHNQESGSSMTAYFRCPACHQQHPTRLQAADRETFEIITKAFGVIEEKCSAEGKWVTVGADDLVWKEASVRR